MNRIHRKILNILPPNKKSISWFITLLLWAQSLCGVRRLSVRSSLLEGKRKVKLYVFFAFVASLIGLFAFDLYYVDLADSMRIRSTVDLHILLYSFTIVWVVFSVGVIAFWCFDIQKKYIIPLICCGILCVYYVNLMYEFCIPGDTLDYAAAVNNLINNEVFHPRYLYPPFFAILFQPLVEIGGGRLLFDVIWIGNFISIITLYVLLVCILKRYGASGTISSLLSFVFMLVNVPIMRTLVFGQINLWITICIIGCVLTYTRPSLLLLSALLLSIAIHLKVSPLLCILPFIITRDIIWTSLLLFFTCLILVGTLLADGFLPYISFFQNIIDLRDSIGLSYRDGSIDSLAAAIMKTLLSDNTAMAGLGSLIVKGAYFIYGLFVMNQMAQSNVFTIKGPEKTKRVLNMIPVVMLLMVALSPVMWEHHPIMAALPFLAGALTIRTRSNAFVYFLSFICVFCLPTFDFFPWSYAKIPGFFIFLVFLHRAATINVPGILQSIDMNISFVSKSRV